MNDGQPRAHMVLPQVHRGCFSSLRAFSSVSPPRPPEELQQSAFLPGAVPGLCQHLHLLARPWWKTWCKFRGYSIFTPLPPSQAWCHREGEGIENKLIHLIQEGRKKQSSFELLGFSCSLLFPFGKVASTSQSPSSKASQKGGRRVLSVSWSSPDSLPYQLAEEQLIRDIPPAPLAR